MGIELLFPFIASVAVTIGLRRLDKSNTKLSQIKRYAGKLSEEIQDTALLQIQYVKDASIDIELQLKQARKTSEDIQILTGESRVLFEEIKSNRQYLSELSEDMASVVSLSLTAKKESEILHNDLANVQNYRLEIGYMKEDMNTLRDEVSQIMEVFQGKLDVRSDDILQSLAHKLIELEALMEKKSDSIDKTMENIANASKTKMSQMASNIFQETIGKIESSKREVDGILELFNNSEKSLDLKISKFEDTTAILSEKVDRFDERLEDRTSKSQLRVEEKIHNLEKKLTDKFDRILEQASHSKESFLEGIRSEIHAIKKEIEDLSLDTMTRRDEILNETRRQAENLNTSILDFQEKYLEAENKLFKQADSRKSELLRQMESFADEFRTVSEELKYEADTIRGETLAELKSFHKDIELAKKDSETKSIESIQLLKQNLETKIQSDFGQIEDKLLNMGREIQSKMGSVDSYVNDLRAALTVSAKEILEEAEKKAYSFEDIIQKEVHTIEKRIESMIVFWDEEVKTARERIISGIDDLDSRIQKINWNGEELVKKFQEEYSDSRRKLEEFISMKELSLVEDTKSYQNDLVDKFKVLKKTTDEFFSKQELKVGKLDENIENKINKQLAKLVDKGNIQLGQIEDKVQKHIMSLKSDLDEAFKENKEEFKTFKQEIDKGIKEALDLKEEILKGVSISLTSIREEVDSLTSNIYEAKSELHSFEESRKAIEKSETVVEDLSLLLEDFKNQESNIQEISNSLDRAMEIKNSLELDILSFKKELELKTKMESKIFDLSNSIEHLTQESAKLQKTWEVFHEFEERLDRAMGSQTIIKEYMEEVRETKDSLKLVQSLQEDQLNHTETISDRITDIDRAIQIIESREKELALSIQSADSRAKHLMDREKDILKVESRFEKIESLIGDLGERHKQTLTLQKRIEELRVESNRSKEELEEVIVEADEKFEKLSAFLDIVQNSIPNQKNPVNFSKEKIKDPILDRKKATILTLHQKHNWNSETISQKLGIEKSLVDMILGIENTR